MITNRRSPISFRPLAFFLLFQLLVLAFCFIAGFLLFMTGFFLISPFQISWTLYFFLGVISTLSVIEYKKGIDSIHFLCTALVAAPIAATMFAAVYSGRDVHIGSWTSFSIIAITIFACTGMSFVAAFVLIAIAQGVERKIYPYYDRFFR